MHKPCVCNICTVLYKTSAKVALTSMMPVQRLQLAVQLQQRYCSYREEQTANCLRHGVGYIVRYNTNRKRGPEWCQSNPVDSCQRGSGMLRIMRMTMPRVELDFSPTHLHILLVRSKFELMWFRVESSYNNIERDQSDWWVARYSTARHSIAQHSTT